MELKSKAELRKEFFENGCNIRVGAITLTAEHDGIHLNSIYTGSISVFDADDLETALNAFFFQIGLDTKYALYNDDTGIHEVIAVAKNLEDLKHLANFRRGVDYADNGFVYRMVIVDENTGEIMVEYERDYELKHHNLSVRACNCLFRAGYYMLDSLRGFVLRRFVEHPQPQQTVCGGSSDCGTRRRWS